LGKIEAEDPFRLLGDTSDLPAGIVAAKSKTFVHSSFDLPTSSLTGKSGWALLNWNLEG
jgi:hypothetical protein